MSFVIAFLLTLGLVVVARPLAIRFGLVDVPSGHKIHNEPTPVIGGPVMFIAIALAVLAVTGPGSWTFRVVVGLLPLMLLGLVDDLWRLKPTSRLIIQVAVVGQMLISYNVSMVNLGPILGDGPVQLGLWAIPFTIFALVGLVNAINLVDGMDGLAAGLVAVALAWLLVIAAWLGFGSHGVVLASAALGALLAFLIFNLRHPWNPRALVFLGDSGSLLLGIILGAVLYRCTQASIHPVPPVLALWLLMIPVFDTCSVMLRRLLSGQNPMLSDRLHLHHLLMEAGFSHGQVVAVLLILATLIGGGAVFLWVLGVPETWLFMGYLLLAVTYFKFIVNPQKAIQALSPLAGEFQANFR